jgi:PKD repeat protein
MKHALNLAAALLLIFGLAACDSIGDGSTLEKLEIVPASNSTQLKNFELGDDYKLFECLRDELIARATFTDGTVANFNSRVTWTSSDPAIVAVSNGDLPVVFATGNPADDGSFYEHESFKYSQGTVVPLGQPGQQATITAKFASLSASLTVEIRKPTLSIVAVPEDDPAAASSPYYLGQDTSQRLAVLANLDGRSVALTDLAGVLNGFNINPLLWVFPTGTFVPEDEDDLTDVDEWVIEASGERIATLRAGSGLVRGVKANFTPYPVYAESSLCPASSDPTLRPLADVQVALLYDDPATTADDRLVLSREAGFNGGGFAPEDIVAETNQQFELRGKLDVDGDGDGLPAVEQHLNAQAAYRLEPLNAGCENSDELRGCAFNAQFSTAVGGLVLAGNVTEGDEGRVQACLPFCLPALASLDVDDATVGLGVPANFTATAVDAPSGVTVHYLFDFGDETTQGPQASANASHAYSTAGNYTATVRLVDAAHPDDFLSQNAGAVRVLAGVTPPAGNTAPTAVLAISSTSGDAPFSVSLSATGSSDPDSGDSITVYEFDPGDGSPVIRQNSRALVHVYRDGTGSPFTPTLRVYDENGVASAVDTDDETVAVEGVAPEFIRSNAIDLRGREAVLCSAEILPPLAAATEQAAFTFPGVQFKVLGSFVADTETDACTDPPIGTQLVTRYMNWFVRPAGDTEERSDIAGIRIVGDDYHVPGQVVYFQDVADDTVLDITGTSLLGDDVEATPSQLTVTPCTGCTP